MYKPQFSVLVFPLRILRTARCIQTVRSLSTKESLVDLTIDDGGIAILTMQRPPVNSLNLEFLQTLTSTLDEVERSKPKGLIISSASPSVFSAGLDLSEMYDPNIERLSQFWTAVQGFWYKLFSAPYPTAAAINGHAPAGGCLIAISCQYRTMVEGNYRIGLNETAVGIAVPQWLSDTMCLVIPQRQAELALTTAKMFTVDEALKIGLIDETATDKADGIEKSKNFIRKFDKITSFAHSVTKKRMRENVIESFLVNREADLNQFKHVCLQPQVQEIIGQLIQNLKQKASR